MTNGLDALVSQQQIEISMLREKVRQLEEALSPKVFVPVEFGLTSTEAKVYAFLLGREIATKEAIMLALYSDRGGDAPEIKIVDVLICKLRRKLTPFGITIETVWGQGYYIRDRFGKVPEVYHG